MLDVREHIISLLAVFLALGLGILIGLHLGNEQVLEGQQLRLVQDIERRLAGLLDEQQSLRQENERLQTLVAAAEAAADKIVQQYQSDCFRGRTVWYLEIRPSGQDQATSAGEGTAKWEPGYLADLGATLVQREFHREQMPRGAEPAEAAADLLSALPAAGASEDNPPLADDGGRLSAIVALPESPATAWGEELAYQVVLRTLEAGVPTIYLTGGEDQAVELLPRLVSKGACVVQYTSPSFARAAILCLLLDYQPGYYGTGNRADALFPDWPSWSPLTGGGR